MRLSERRRGAALIGQRRLRRGARVGVRGAGAPRGVIYYIMFVRATCLNIELLGLVGRNGSVQVELRIRER